MSYAAKIVPSTSVGALVESQVKKPLYGRLARPPNADEPAVPPKLLELCGPMPMSYPAVNHVQYRLTDEGGGRTRVSLVHRAMGLIPEEHRDGMPEGWEFGLKRIREIAEARAKSSKR